MKNCAACENDLTDQIKYICLHCEDDYTLCLDCEIQKPIVMAHFNGRHTFARVKPGFNMDNFYKYKIKDDNGADNTMYDPFEMQKFKIEVIHFEDDADRIQDPLELVKAMLVYENDLRLSAETIYEYEKDQKSSWKTQVTQALQEKVVNHFMPLSRYYDNLEDGLLFLRSAVGNFPENLEELMECANYVKYTQFCVRGELRIGDKVGGKIPEDLAIYSLEELEHTKLGDLLVNDKPNIIMSSSYT